MSLIASDCIEFEENRKVCIAAEKGKAYRLENISGYRVRKVKVDKCIKQSVGEKRCDFLFSFNENNISRAIFIELKGGALSDALRQLIETIKYLKGEFKDYRIDARVVGSKDIPQITSLPVYRELKLLVGKNKGTLERATNYTYIEKI